MGFFGCLPYGKIRQLLLVGLGGVGGDITPEPVSNIIHPSTLGLMFRQSLWMSLNFNLISIYRMAFTDVH